MFAVMVQTTLLFYFMLVLRKIIISLNKLNQMKHFVSVFFLFFFSMFFLKLQAQQKHFIYIQSEDKQPFAVVLDGKVYSSSDYGYVIVPRLTDGDYSFTVSFPMNKYPDQSFKCVINKKDLGYKLENTADKGWALQNMQTQKVLTGSNTTAANNAFGDMLSDVVSDSNLTNKNLPVTKPDTVAASANIDISTVTASVNDTSNSNIDFVRDSVAQLQKISETKQDTGTNMVFIDKTSGADTINVFVPSADSSDSNIAMAKTTADSLTQQQDIATDTFNNNIQKADTIATAINQSSTETTDTAAHAVSNPFYNESTDQNTNTNITPPVNANATVANENLNKSKTTNAIKEDCPSMISDNDMDKLKRKMFVQNNDNDMVQTALKYLNNKCLTTDQVKILGNIFSSDDGRYNLYDALYKSVYDYGNYAGLETQIVDPYYKRRFEAMLR